MQNLDNNQSEDNIGNLSPIDDVFTLLVHLKKLYVKDYLDADALSDDKFLKIKQEVNKLTTVMIRKKEVKEMLLKMLYSQKGKEFDKRAVEIFTRTMCDGRILLKEIQDSDDLAFIDKYRCDFREIYDIRRGLLQIAIDNRHEKVEEQYIAPTYLGYIVSMSAYMYTKTFIKEFEERSPLGSPLIVDEESDEKKYLLVYPEALGCYTFIAWYFPDGKLEFRELMKRLVKVFFAEDTKKLAQYQNLNAKLDCVLPSPLDSMRSIHLFRVNFPPKDFEQIKYDTRRLLSLAEVDCKNFCYASVNQMLDPTWEPYPGENVYCGEKVRLFAMMRQLELIFLTSANKENDIYNKLSDWNKKKFKVEYLKRIFDRKNAYNKELGKYVIDYLRASVSNVE